jgi:hypothetical protein
MKKISILFTLALTFFLTACGTSSYQTGVMANQVSNAGFQNTQNEQLNTIQMCYIYSKNPESCTILAAGAIPTQVLGGRPTPIRVAQAPEEIFKEIATNGFEAAVKIYGLKQIASVVNSATAEAGKVEIVRPEVVRPEVVQPTIVHSVSPAAVTP